MTNCFGDPVAPQTRQYKVELKIEFGMEVNDPLGKDPSSVQSSALSASHGHALLGGGFVENQTADKQVLPKHLDPVEQLKAEEEEEGELYDPLRDLFADDEIDITTVRDGVNEEV